MIISLLMIMMIRLVNNISHRCSPISKIMITHSINTNQSTKQEIMVITILMINMVWIRLSKVTRFLKNTMKHNRINYLIKVGQRTGQIRYRLQAKLKYHKMTAIKYTKLIRVQLESTRLRNRSKHNPRWWQT